MSETMVRAMDKITDYQPGPAGLDGWLFGIARNVALEAHRSGARTTAPLRAEVRRIVVRRPDGRAVVSTYLPAMGV